MLDASPYDAVGRTPGVVAIVASLAVAISVSRYYYVKGKQTKYLDWEPIDLRRIVAGPVSKMAEGLSLTWQATTQLQTPYIVSLQIANGGSSAILEGRPGYQQPLTISLANGTVYDAFIYDQVGTVLDPPVRVPLINIPCQSFTVKMPTLNEGSSLKLQMIVDGDLEFPDIQTLLVGQTQPIGLRDRSSLTRLERASTPVIFAGLVVLSIGFGLLGWQSYAYTDGPTLWPITLVVIGGLVTLFATLLYVLARAARIARRKALIAAMRTLGHADSDRWIDDLRPRRRLRL